MIATSLQKVATQPFDFTCNSSPCILGNSVSILAAVLHYVSPFVLFFLQVDLFLVHVKMQRLLQPSGLWHAKVMLPKCILYLGQENSAAAEAFSKRTETDA